MEDPIWPPEERAGDTDSDRTARVRPGGVAEAISGPGVPAQPFPPNQPFPPGQSQGGPPPVPAPPAPGQFPAEGATGFPTAEYRMPPSTGPQGQPPASPGQAPWATYGQPPVEAQPGPAQPPAFPPPAFGQPGYEHPPGGGHGQPPTGAPYTQPHAQDGQPPVAEPPYGQPPVADSPYGQPPVAEPPFGQPVPESPFGPPPAQSPYGQPPIGVPGQPVHESPFGPPPGAPHGQPPIESPFGPPPGGPYGSPPGAPPFVPPPVPGAFGPPGGGPGPGEFPPPPATYGQLPGPDPAPAPPSDPPAPVSGPTGPAGPAFDPSTGPVSGPATGLSSEAAPAAGPPLPWNTEAATATPTGATPATGTPAVEAQDEGPMPTSPWSQPIYRPTPAAGPNGSSQDSPAESPQDPAADPPAPEAAPAGNQPTGNQPTEGGPAEVAPSSPGGPAAVPVYFPVDQPPILHPGVSQPVQPAPQANQPPAGQPPQSIAPWQSTAGPLPAQPQAPYVQQQPFGQPPYPQPPSAAFQTHPPAQAQPHAAGPHGAPPQPSSSPEQPTTPRVDEQGQYIPTAEEFARRREVRPSNPVATMGVRGALRRSTFGLVRPGPGKREQEHRHLVETIRRNFGGLRQVTVVNPKGGAGKTVAVLLLSMTFGQSRGGYILAWDNNETQGTLGMRALQDFHSRTVRDLMRDLDHFQGAHGRVGDLSQYVRSQGEGMFDVLASDESATAGEMLTAMSFGDLREVVSRFYKLIFVDTGNNVRAENWQAAIDATDQLVVTMSARNDSAETAARMLDHLEQNGRNRLVRQAVTVVSMPPSRRDLDIPSITRHFSARTRTVMLAPYEKLIDSGEPIRYAQLSAPTRLAWLRIGAAVAEGL